MSQPNTFGGNRPVPKIRLSFLEGPRANEQIQLEVPAPGGAPLTFGRNRENSVTIDSPHLSRRHAEIFADFAGRLLIRDAGSINGTIVNGRLANPTEAIQLNAGDQIRVGDTLFIFEGLFGPGVEAGGRLPQPNLVTQPSSAAREPERTTTPTPPSSTHLPPTVPLEAEEPEPQLTEDSYLYLLLRTGQRYLFNGEEATVGRGQGNDVVIDSNSISRQHARLQRTPEGVYVSDLGSTNKTFVNGVLAEGPVLLHHNDVVRFGDIEADFRIENERQTGFFNRVDQTLMELPSDSTQRDFTRIPTDDSDADWSGPGLEQLETALDIDIRDLRIVGRKGRQSSDALPETGNLGIQAQPQSPVNANSQAEVARVEGVYFTEGQGRAAQQILRDVRLGLRQGELVAVVGPSGSGKSELVQIMAGLLPADKGRVTVYNREFPSYESAGRRLNLEADRDFVRWRARNIGYFYSGQQLDMKRPAYEQVMQPMEIAGLYPDNRERQKQAFERLQLVGLRDPEVARLRPTDLNRTEKQLVMLARTLANDPPLLLCDEPLGNLTSEAANFVFNLLKRLVANGKTVLMVTQDQLWSRNASRIIEILDGAIVGSLS